MSRSTFSRDVERAAHLLTCARAGDTTPLVEYLYAEVLPAMAANMAGKFACVPGSCLDMEDVLHAGMERVLHSLNVALLSPNPIGYLVKAAQGCMVDFCVEQHSAIRLPSMSYRSCGHKRPDLVSLEVWQEVRAEDGACMREIADPSLPTPTVSESVRTRVFSALGKLCLRQRAVLMSSFGIEDEQTGLVSLPQEVQQGLGIVPNSYRGLKSRALERMRQVLLVEEEVSR